MKLYSADELEDLPTLCTGQADDLKIETTTLRVWLSRVDGQVSYEKLCCGRWETVEPSDND